MLWVSDRQHFPGDGVDQREERGIRADAERERQHCRRRESGMLPEAADRVPDVLARLLEPRPSPFGARILGGQRQIPQLARFGHRGNGAQFFLHVALRRTPPPGQEVCESLPEHHGSISRAVGFIILATALTNSAHSDLS